MKIIDSFKGEYRWLSNFWPCEVEYEGVVYPTVENAYQASKTLDLEMRNGFVGIYPGDAKGKGRRLALRPNFEELKIQIMYELLLSKFENENLQAKLVETGDAWIIEGNTWGDTYWGQCNGQGHNELGKLLMLVRNEFIMRRKYNYDKWLDPKSNQEDPIDENGNRGDFVFYDKEDCGGKVDGESFPVLCELIFESDEEMCKEPL